MEVKYRRVTVLPPTGKQQKYPALSLTIIYAQERGCPQDRERISWKLITDLYVGSKHDAIEKLNWYAMRWKIEVFHKILKSGCKAETSKLRATQRLNNLIAIFCILSWRIFWITMLNRTDKDISPTYVLTLTEIELLDLVVKDTKKNICEKMLSDYLIKIAKLGGYLARTKDPPPGNTAIWRGLIRLTDIQLGFLIGKNCG